MQGHFLILLELDNLIYIFFNLLMRLGLSYGVMGLFRGGGLGRGIGLYLLGLF